MKPVRRVGRLSSLGSGTRSQGGDRLRSGHVTYGLGTPQRVRRRFGDANDRVVVLAECGDVRLSAAEKAVARPVEISHELLRQIGHPVADYLEVACPAGK